MLRDKVCIVTGGAGSIGFATAELFLAERARVLLVDLPGAVLDSAGARLACDRLLVQAADVGDAGQTAASPPDRLYPPQISASASGT